MPTETAMFKRIKLQVPIYPVTQFANLSTTSSLIYRESKLIKFKRLMARVYAIYMFGADARRNESLVDSLHKGRHMTQELRDSLQPMFEFGDPDSGNEEDRIVTKEQRVRAAALRARPQELDPVGDPQLEARFKQTLLNEMSPLLAPSLAGLPPAYVVTCEFDPVRDDGLLYAKRLRKAGVAVTLKHYPDMMHGKIFVDPNNTIQRDFARWFKTTGML